MSVFLQKIFRCAFENTVFVFVQYKYHNPILILPEKIEDLKKASQSKIVGVKEIRLVLLANST